MKTSIMSQKKRNKLEIAREIVKLIDKKEELFLSDFQEIGVSNPNALTYCELMKFFNEQDFTVEIIKIKKSTIIRKKKLVSLNDWRKAKNGTTNHDKH